MADGRGMANPDHMASTAKGKPVADDASQVLNILSPKKKAPKRRRTRSHNSSPSPGRGFFVPGFENPQNGAGHKMMSLSELMDAAKGVTNMYLAHEIAVDKDFRLEKINGDEKEETQEPTTFEAHIKKIIHQAFWDLLAEELKEEPPVYNQALSLLDEVRTGLCKILLPSQHRIKANIMERLDLDLIKQQADNGVLDFDSYAVYVLDLMGKLCAPVRDDEINALKEIDHKDVVKLFQGIMKTLDHMRIDMANFMIQQARPMIMSQSVEYEKIKFKEFLETQNDGLEFTRAWLKRHAPSEEENTALQGRIEEARFKKLLTNRILTEALVELLEWDEYYTMPETLAMDHKRIVDLRDQTERTSVSTAVILVTFSNISGLVIPMDAQKLKETIKGHVDILLQEFFDDTTLLAILPNVALQAIKDINDYLKEKGKAMLPDSTRKNLEDQIAELEDPNHRIRDLIQKRIIDFNKQAIAGSRSAPLQIPPGLTLCQKELAQIAGGFVRLVSYNRAVFGEFYEDIIENHVFFKPNDNGNQKESSNES
jgi:hypothetical protein